MSTEKSDFVSSERRLAANRANAQLSTGPRTPEGKAKSSLNAVKTGLCGRTVLFADEEEAAAYRAANGPNAAKHAKQPLLTSMASHFQLNFAQPTEP